MTLGYTPSWRSIERIKTQPLKVEAVARIRAG
jgi:hypothetical protein